MAGQQKSQNGTFNKDPDFSSTVVPQQARMSKTSLTMAWWAMCSAMIWLLISATLAMNYGSADAILGLSLSVLTYGIINNIISQYAIKTGLSVGLFSKKVYGKVGEILATCIFFSIAIYYCVFEGSVIAVALARYFPALELWHAYLIVVLYSVPLVFGGVNQWLDKFNGILLPFYYLGLFIAVLMTINLYGYSNQWLNMGPKDAGLDGNWWQCYSYFMGLWIMMMYTWDYARFGKVQDIKYHSSVNFGIPFYVCTYLVNGLIGIFLVASIPTSEALSELSIVFALLKLMGFTGLVFIWVSQTRINTANFQLATVNLQSFIYGVFKRKLSKVTVAVLIGIAVFCLMLTDVFSFILQALAYQSIFVVAWVVIALSYIFIHRKDALLATLDTKGPQQQTTSEPYVKASGLVAWLSSSGAGLVMLNSTGQLPHYASLATIIIAVSVYFLMERFARASLSRKPAMLTNVTSK